MLISGDEADVSFAPWSLRYSGHQFGACPAETTPSRGPTRAISIRTCLPSSACPCGTFQRLAADVTPHPSDPETTYEPQLKGAGRTPFSRSGDDLVVVRSSVREYFRRVLCGPILYGAGEWLEPCADGPRMRVLS
ncbi:hypothetical protein BC826DRAFT_1033131, partial [Russula brevipes]